MKRTQSTTLTLCMSLAFLCMGSHAWGATSPTSKLARAVQDTVDTLRSLESRLDTIDDQIADERETVRTLDRSLDTGKDPKAIVTALNEAAKRVSRVEDHLDSVGESVASARDKLKDFADSAKKMNDKQLGATIAKAMDFADTLRDRTRSTKSDVDQVKQAIKKLLDEVNRILDIGVG